MKRQPESTTEDLEDARDQGDADDEDMNASGAVCEEPVITIGVDGEMLDGCENDEESYIDDVNGGFLDPEMVREARVEEFAGYLAMQVYCRVPVAECGSHRVIKTRWVDTNEGDDWFPEIRCQLVAKEVKKRNNTEEESAAISLLEIAQLARVARQVERAKARATRKGMARIVCNHLTWKLKVRNNGKKQTPIGMNSSGNQTQKLANQQTFRSSNVWNI